MLLTQNHNSVQTGCIGKGETLRKIHNSQDSLGGGIFSGAPGLQESQYPKDPAVLKILRRSIFTMRSK